MALYTISNLSPGRVRLPSPCDRSLSRGGSTTIEIPASLLDDPQGGLSLMVSKGMISVTAAEGSQSSSTQIPSVQVVRSIINRRSSLHPLYNPDRFFNQTIAPTIYVEPATGDDDTGDGLTKETAYATVNRALKDLPEGWTAAAVIAVAAGTVTGNQVWSLNATPGPRSTTGTGTVTILGEHLTPVETLTTGPAGVVVAGRKAQFDFSYGAFSTTITDGSHYLKGVAVVGTGGLPLRASTSPTLRAVAVSGTGTAANTPGIFAWTTIFSGTITVESKLSVTAVLAFMTVGAIRFGAAVTGRGVAFRNCRFDVGSTFRDCVRSNCTNMAGTHFVSGVGEVLSESTQFYVAGSLSLSGYIPTLQFSVFAGAPSAAAKICIGGTSNTVTTANTVAHVRLLASIDFEGTGDGIRMLGGRIHSQGSATAGSFAITGRPLSLYAGAVIWGAWAWAGTGGLPSILQDGAMLLSNTGYAVTNSVTAGQDITVGSLAVQAVTTRNTTDAAQLCRYT